MGDLKVSGTKVKIQYYFTDRIKKVAFDTNIDNHHDKHANSIITIISKCDIIGIDINYLIKIKVEMANFYA